MHFDEDYDAMNVACVAWFAPGRRRARTCVGVNGLANCAGVEINLVARRPGGGA